jgi:Na+-transporting NADH:ubiquinone oxidoreductase subunit NqrB
VTTNLKLKVGMFSMMVLVTTPASFLVSKIGGWWSLLLIPMMVGLIASNALSFEAGLEAGKRIYKHE